MVVLLGLTLAFLLASVYFRAQVIATQLAQSRAGQVAITTTYGPLGRKLAIRAVAQRVDKLKALKRARLWSEVGFGVMVVIDIIYISFLVLTLFTLILPMFAFGSGIVGGGGRGLSALDSKEESSISTPQPGTAKEAIGGSLDAPAGADKEDWSKADELGQKIARTAYDAAIMPFPEAGDKSNATESGGMAYDMGDTPIGVYDCSTFVSAVLEANGILSSGGKREGTAYDFKTMRKADLQNYEVTTQEMESWSKLASPVTEVGNEGWEDKVQAGDLVVNGHHVGVFIGKNSKGELVMAHAASWDAGRNGSVLYNDYDRAEATQEVGLNIGDEIYFMFARGDGKVYRPSQMYS